MAGNFWAKVADAFIPGNAYNNTTGQWNKATLTTGLIGMGAEQLLPGGGALVRNAAKGGLFGSDLQGRLEYENVRNDLADYYGQWKKDMGVQARQLAAYNASRPMTQGYTPRYVPDASFNPGSLFRPSIPNISYGPSYGGQNLGNYGAVTRETFAVPQPGAQVNDLKDIASFSPGAVRGPGGSSAPTSYAAQAMGGRSQGGGHGTGWTGVSGDAARSMMAGLSQSSSDAINQNGYLTMLRNNIR